MTDTGYLGLQNVHGNTTMPKKRSKKNPLTKEDKRHNHKISKDRVPAEHVIGAVKRFKIVSDRYRNRRKRFGLRFTLIAAAYNKDVMP
jgi:DDE superfamily endonuclease